MSLRYEFCAQTDCGRLRPNNEDSVAFHPQEQLALLADGMGGYNAGEVASRMATDLIGAGLTQWFRQAGLQARLMDLRLAIEGCVDAANRSIFDASRSQPQYAGMGTTLVVASFHSDRLILGHIGDSRCYRLRDGHLQQITRDHSWLQEQIDAGLLTRQQAAESGGRHLVTRALGVEPRAHMEINEFAVHPGDLFVLCSDGLTDMVSDEDLATLARMPTALPKKAKQMVEHANLQGGRDNISVLLVQAALAEAAPASVSGGARRG